MPSDPLIARILGRYVDRGVEPTAAELAINERIERMSTLMEGVMQGVREIDRLREETYALLESGGAEPLSTLDRVAAHARKAKRLALVDGALVDVEPEDNLDAAASEADRLHEIVDAVRDIMLEARQEPELTVEELIERLLHVLGD